MVALMRLQHRAQEWLADRVSWVQYPNVRQIGRKSPRFFRHAMPASTRITLALLGLMALFILIPAITAGGFFLYAIIGAVFGWLPAR